ncbi:MAG: hypothetical protein CSA33_00320 [Desulfobulbus propionicus]|nr:MAG: hypothetical protein CSA33_00320 [Desulfobulbus propionicus]
MDRLHQKKNILCIDDDKGMHVLLESQLVSSGNYNSLHAINGEEALSTLKEFSVDLIILDINMPKMNGFQLLDHLKQDQKSQQIPVIVLSSLTRENLKVKALERGAEDFIVKPFTGPELVARIKAVLRRNAPCKQEIVSDVQGKLQELGLSDLLHMFSFSKKSGKITFPQMDGEIIIASGTVLSAQQGTWHGKEALLRLFFLEKGSFNIHYGIHKGEDIGTIESLLLCMGKSLDELHNHIKKITLHNPQVHLLADDDDFPEIRQLKEKMPLSLHDLILSMQGELKTNLDLVRQALQKGSISIDAS